MYKKKNLLHKIIVASTLSLAGITFVNAQQSGVDSASFYNEVKTYVNPVLPGDHPDPTLFHKGKDFYYCGSSFHFTPYLPIYHSTDLMHWQIISRVVYPQNAGFVQDAPSRGIWQGAITYFYGSWRIYFSANGDQQWFCKASSPYGPWSKPIRVETNPKTGPLGYDNSIFIDDDGRPYMVIKNGQRINHIQALGKDGQLTDTVIKLDWINANLQYSWAEGPVMCKRNGYYYYFPAGSVAGGEYVLRSKELTSDSTKWERLGDFFKPITDKNVRFRVVNHIAAPLELSDGSWWTIGQSYDDADGDDWSGMGRQTSLFPVTWEDNRPWGMAPTSQPIVRPELPLSGHWRSVHSDYFDKDSLNVCWHFLNRKAEAEYSLTARKGWLRLSPNDGRTHILQKETDKYYSVVTRVNIDAASDAAKAGIYLTNGNQSKTVMLGLANGKIIFQFDTAMRTASNPFGNTVWLKLERKAHELYGYFSNNGEKWISLGTPISSVDLDKVQPQWNSWVGTSVGLFAQGRPADFNCFICKDGFSELPAIAYSNYFGVVKTSDNAVTNVSQYGGWEMISGVDLGHGKRAASKIAVEASATKTGVIEIWLDDLKSGQLIAKVPVDKLSGDPVNFSSKIKRVTGHHDVFIKFPSGNKEGIRIKCIRFY